MSKITDAEANATSLDGLVNDNALVPTLRNGPKPSYQYLVDGWTTEVNDLLDRTAGVGTENAYETTAEGIAATVDGDYFSVVSSNDNNYLDLYLNNNGVAVLKKSYPSVEKISEIESDISENYAVNRIGRYTLIGGLLSYGTLDGNTGVVVVSYSDLRLFTGANSQTPLKINAASNVQIPQNQCLYLDLSSPNGDGSFDLQVTTTAFYSAVENGQGGFVDNDKISFLFNYGGLNRGGILLDAKSNRHGLGDVIVPWTDCEVSFDKSTRTLSWTGDLYFLYNRGARLKLNSGSVTFPDSNEGQVAYVSMQDVTDLANADPSICVKTGRYYTGGDRFLANEDQIPMFYYSDGNFGSLKGFPVIDESKSAVDVLNKDVVVKVTEATSTGRRMEINIRDKGNENNRFIQYRFWKLAIPSRNTDVWHIWDARVVASDLTTVIKTALVNGEMETAVQEDGKADFVGGSYHGNEIAVNADVFINGEVIDFSSTGTYYGNEIVIRQESQCYEYGTFTEGVDNGTPWFKAFKTWTFNSDGVLITNQSEFQRDALISTFYNCFLAIARNEDGSTNATTAMYGAQSPKFEKRDLIARNHPRYFVDDVKKAISWGGGIYYEAEFIDGYFHQDPTNTEYSPSINEMFFQADNAAYNKIYFRQGFTEIRTGAVISNTYRYKVKTSL